MNMLQIDTSAQLSADGAAESSEKKETITLQLLQPSQASAVAKIHMLSQEDTFLTSLGEDFLILLYKQISQSDYGISYVALYKDEVVGFAIGTSHTDSLFKDIILKHPVQLGWLVFKQALSRPILLWYTLRTLVYPNQMPADGPKAELLALAVSPNWRNRRIGSGLLQQLIQDMRAIEIDKIVVTVDGHNEDALRFYQRHNFVRWFDNEMYGRPMAHLTLSL